MNEQTQNYVRQHADDDVRQLALRGCKDPLVDLPRALQQIQGLQTARRKLPTWAACEGVQFPPHLNMEQCSSEQTARYKEALCRRILERASEGERTLTDLTGGFGVDFTLMARAFDRATYVERDPQLFAITSGNLKLLVQTPHTALNTDGIGYLHTIGHTTMLFLDPARRDDHGGRTYSIADCTPDVLAVKDELLARVEWVLLKLSPMLDWRKAVRDLGEDTVREVHIVAVGGECKELLVLMSRKGTGRRLWCVNDGSVFMVEDRDGTFRECPQEERGGHEDWGEPQAGMFLYEPNGAIMKGGCFEAVAARFGVRAVARNSHLFVSRESVGEFPGRAFRIEGVTTMNKRGLRQTLNGLRQANIAVRNFPLSVSELRKRLQLADGGDAYLFATTLADDTHVIILCRRN